MNVLGSPSPLHPSSLSTGTTLGPLHVTELPLFAKLKRVCVCTSHPQDTGVVSRPHHERGGSQDDHPTRPSRRVRRLHRATQQGMDGAS